MASRKVMIKSLDILSVGKIQALILAVFGFILGAFFALMSLSMGSSVGNSPMAGMMGGIGAIIFIPIVYAIIGFIGGIITAVIYNLAASAIGGIEMEFNYTNDQL
ncbi:MAG: hypothetical protein F6K04_03055 [Leptolyngbya sp. SIO4C5]|uniref:hypothetical protein n=1 Tax=Sphaerothrix gracilis TaxID=3151835 RepID=UPI0013C10565|nr:hypothetical protein [Leptolyngbya sp. SIO4C5]